MRVDHMQRMVSLKMRMVRWMSEREKRQNEELLEGMDAESISDVIRWSWLRWLGHVLRGDLKDRPRGALDLEVEDKRSKGRPKKTGNSKERYAKFTSP